MNTKSLNKDIENSFNEIFSFDNPKDSLDIEAKLLMAKFLSKIQEIADDKDIKRNELAEEIGTSASYLTQLFRGHKLINFVTLAKLQKALDIKFDIKVVGKDNYENPINKDSIADHLDKWYETNRTGEYLKVVRNNLSVPKTNGVSDYNFSIPKTKHIAS